MEHGGTGAYWRASLRRVVAIVGAWAAVSLGAAVLGADALDRFHLAGFPLGFWLGQQGAILAFVALAWIHVAVMSALDRAHGGER